ncbi:MAG: acyltransferase [Planctomycetota bacterium]
MHHETALVETDSIGEGSRVFAYAHVMKGATLGSNVKVGDHAFIESGAHVGNNVTIKNGVYLWEGIRVEDDVFLGPRVTFTNDRFPRSPRMPAAAERYAAKENWLESTNVRRGASIGAASVICPGVEIGEFATVAAGSVVTKDVRPFSLVVGNPARKVADLCSCGQRLKGTYLSSTCEHCGEAPDDRIAKLCKQPAAT